MVSNDFFRNHCRTNHRQTASTLSSSVFWVKRFGGFFPVGVAIRWGLCACQPSSMLKRWLFFRICGTFLGLETPRFSNRNRSSSLEWGKAESMRVGGGGHCGPSGESGPSSRRTNSAAGFGFSHTDSFGHSVLMRQQVPVAPHQKSTPRSQSACSIISAVTNSFGQIAPLDQDSGLMKPRSPFHSTTIIKVWSPSHSVLTKIRSPTLNSEVLFMLRE